MPTKNQFFSLQEISKHLLNEVVLADADFQLAQQAAWQKAGANSDWMRGFAPAGQLQVNEFDFNISIQRYQPSLWMRLVWLINKQEPKGTLFRISNKNENKNEIQVKFILQRANAGNYNTKIESNPPIVDKPENTYVAGVFK